MALTDSDIFSAICQINPGQSIETIMNQYEKAKRINIEIEKRLAAPVEEEKPEAVEEVVVMEAPVVEEQPPKKKYTRRQLKVKPQDAIKEGAIFCCICGEERQSLTAKHLAGHGITVAEYKELCGYSPKQPLMSLQHLANSHEVIAKAQQARMEKRAANNG